MFRVFPVLLIVVTIYSAIALAHGLVGNDAMQTFLAREHVTFHMFSGDLWDFNLGDLLVTLGFVCLFIEIVKSTRTSRRALVNHGLSVLVFVIAIIEFIVVRGFSTSVFFFIMVMTAFDVIAGYTISVVAAEHDLGVGRAGTDPR
ncbi:MAG TPA: hypothetical protein VHU23_11625 [Rhizomicrobium sp.]|jgi:hypothetical protein|nr:hypothetical protein [Rhizomicrobium sp.]